MLKLIDNRAEKEIDVDGTKVVIRQLLLPEKQALAWVVSKYKDGDKVSMALIPLDELIPAIVPGFVRADGVEYDNPVDFFYRLPEARYVWKIAIEISNASGITDSEAKNSGSSSKPSRKASAGNATKNAKRAKSNASKAKKN